MPSPEREDEEIDLANILLEKQIIAAGVNRGDRPDFDAFIDALPDVFTAEELFQNIERNPAFVAHTAPMKEKARKKYLEAIMTRLTNDIMIELELRGIIPSAERDPAGFDEAEAWVENLVYEVIDQAKAHARKEEASRIPMAELGNISVFIPRLRAQAAQRIRDWMDEAMVMIRGEDLTQSAEEEKKRNEKEQSIMPEALHALAGTFGQKMDARSLAKEFQALAQKRWPADSVWLQERFLDYLSDTVTQAHASTIPGYYREDEETREDLAVKWKMDSYKRLKELLATEASPDTTPPSSSSPPQS